MAAPDYYQILGISPTSTAEAVRAACDRLAGAYEAGPDSGRLAQGESIIRACEVLGDPKQRAAYDRVRRLLTQRRLVSSKSVLGNWALWLLPLAVLAMVSLAIFLVFSSPISRPVPAKTDTASPTKPPPIATTPTTSAGAVVQPTKISTLVPTKGAPSREICLDVVKKDGLEAFRMGCDAVLELGVLKASLEEASSSRLEQLFADLESLGVTARTHAEVGSILDTWIEASEKLRNAGTREEAQTSYRGMAAEEQKLASLRDALRQRR